MAELQHSASRLSLLSNQLTVEEDGGSDGEERLSNILEEEEAGGRWRRGSMTSTDGALYSMDICDM